ncbi:protein shisa-5 [Mycetomoellerius zeteki]|uniref:protein shisa-5 n=1 Tax=Mycetomoellerius zeteki TaxID=64791 RepID=UPI00084EA94D|nr:PREDICTED: protein shisa-5-like [Trachymyrmex zeteki]
MSRLEVALLLICLHAGYVYGVECNFEILERNLFDHWTATCPRFFDKKDESWCCIDVEARKSYCCDLETFVQKTGVGVFLPLIIAGVGIIAILSCCISCFCCSCCPWYRRRQGTTYGNIQTPVVQVIQSPANIPPGYTSQPTQNIPTSYTSQPTQNYVPPYPMGSTAMPQPPPYTDEAYAKQAPYNPAYLPSQ